MPKDTQFELRLLGSMEMQRKGKRVQFERRKTIELLAYLAMHPQEHTREKLAGLFWRDASEESARLSLRVVINDLRRNLGERCLIGRDGVRLNSNFPLWVDAREFQRLTDSRSAPADWRAALELYAGDLLPQVYDDWVLEWRSDFEQACVETRLRLAQHERGQRHYESAIELARAALEVEPARESVHQLIIACYESLGEREAALRHYEICREVLRGVGVEPSLELQAVHRRLQKIPAASKSVTSNLPRPLTSFIGREDELNEIETLLNETRALTLLGAGGSGKTRLAIQAADESAHNYPDGVWWADLSPLAAGDLIPQAVAKSLGMKEKGGADLLEQIGNFIAERRMLIVLDNCEHLLSAAAQCAEFLCARCPSLTFLSTSREPLGIAGEIGWQTPTLPLPESGAVNLKTLMKNESARLFVERGRAVNGSFQLNAQNAARVAEICRRLEGIPLAIELAAAQINNLTLDGILERLQKALDLSARQSHARHATLRAALQWSYDLLNPVERILFRRLAVFAGGWNLSAAAVIAAGYENAESVLAHDALDAELSPLPITGEMVTRQVLDNLVKKALAHFRRNESSLRYDMLDTLREFAREKLIEAGESKIMEERHARVFFGMLENLWADAYTEREGAAFNQVEQELANLRLAWAWQMKSKTWLATPNTLACQSRFWYVRGHYAESREILSALLQHPSMKKICAARGELLNNLGLTEWQIGNHAAAQAYFRRALKDYEKLKMDKNAAMTQINLGGVFLTEDNLDAAQELTERGLAAARAANHERALVIGLNNLATIFTDRRDFARARITLTECLNLRRKLGDLRGMGITLNNLADLEAEEQNYPRAKKLYGESFACRVQVGDRRGMVITALNILRLMNMAGEWERAAQLLGFAEETLAQLGIRLPAEARTAHAEVSAATRDALNQAIFNEAYAQGKKLAPDEVYQWLIAE